MEIGKEMKENRQKWGKLGKLKLGIKIGINK